RTRHEAVAHKKKFGDGSPFFFGTTVAEFGIHQKMRRTTSARMAGSKAGWPSEKGAPDPTGRRPGCCLRRTGTPHTEAANGRGTNHSRAADRPVERGLEP